MEPMTEPLPETRRGSVAVRRFLDYPMYRAYRGRTNRELRLFALSRREE